MSSVIPKEVDRLLTFGSWPKGHPIDASSLAGSGFVYLGVADEIECCFCKFRIRDIRDKESLKLRHAEEKPDCPIIKIMYGNQIPARQSGNRRPLDNVVADGARSRLLPATSGMSVITDNVGVSLSQMHPEDDPMPRDTRGGNVEADTVLITPPTSVPFSNNRRGPDTVQLAQVARPGSMMDEESREATFDRSQWRKSHIVHPRDLAKAGLYYIGPDDYVQCYVCKGVLHNWVAGDVPLTEHRKHFPGCPFAASRSYQSEPPRPTLHSTTALWDHPVVSKVLSMGFPHETVINAVQQRLDSTGRHFETPEQLVEILLQGEDFEEPGYDIPPDEELTPWQFGGRMTQIDEGMNFSEPEPQHVVSQAPRHSPEQSLATSSEEPQSMDEATIAAENEKLREEKVCRICYDRERDIAFIPCGHLVACATCAFSVKNCPVCRQLILSTLRIFK